MGINANRTEPISKGVKMNIIALFSTAIRLAGLSPPDIIYNDAKLHHFSTHKKPDCSALVSGGIQAGSFAYRMQYTLRFYGLWGFP